MAEKKVLDVVKVGFYGNTGDNRSPEDFPFPACMTSLMQYLGEDYPIVELESHHQKYTQRIANLHFITASGMAFGLLWSKDYCKSCMDLTQVNEHNETVKNAFAWAGYEYEIMEKASDGSNREVIRERIVESIDKGLPVLAFGIVGPPECVIISGYDHKGEEITGWSHFQQWEPCEKESNGMFRRAGWYDSLWKIVFIGKKIGRSINLKDVLTLGLSIMEKTDSEGYVAGLAVYDEWIRYVLSNELDTIDDETLRVRHDLHHDLVGNLAEARCWGGDFLLHAAEENKDENMRGVAMCFKNIHDLCWQVWGVLGSYGQQDVWKGFRSTENRRKIAKLLGDIKELDQKAMTYLKLVIR